MKKRVILLILVLAATAGIVWAWSRYAPATAPALLPLNLPIATPTPVPSLPQPPSSFIPNGTHQVYQTFNNCGPASLSMLLGWHGISITQDEIGRTLRPNQNQQGIDDDKSTTFEELGEYAKERYNLVYYHNPSGTLDILRHFTSRGIPVAVRTLLREGDDVGHYRVVKGYNDAAQSILQDDSYDGPNIFIPYERFMATWQPFSYEYLVIVPSGHEDIARQIMGENVQQSEAWQNSLERSVREQADMSLNPFPYFNEARAAYYTGDYERSVRIYEQVQPYLPHRMLWYQLEPLLSYQKLGQYETVLEHISGILAQGNAGYSELYLLRGEIYEAQGRHDEAQVEYQKALQYNINLQRAKDAVSRMQ